MEKQLTPKQKARQKYEIIHKEERDKATKQFNTRLPVKEYVRRYLSTMGQSRSFLLNMSAIEVRNA